MTTQKTKRPSKSQDSSLKLQESSTKSSTKSKVASPKYGKKKYAKKPKKASADAEIVYKDGYVTMSCGRFILRFRPDGGKIFTKGTLRAYIDDSPVHEDTMNLATKARKKAFIDDLEKLHPREVEDTRRYNLEAALLNISSYVSSAFHDSIENNESVEAESVEAKDDTDDIDVSQFKPLSVKELTDVLSQTIKEDDYNTPAFLDQ